MFLSESKILNCTDSQVDLIDLLGLPDLPHLLESKDLGFLEKYNDQLNDT